MGYYRKIDSRIQNDGKFRSLSRDGRLAWYDTFSHPNLNTFGAMRTTLVGLAADLNEENKTFSKAFGENLQKGLIKFSDMLLWFPNYLKYNPPASYNVVKSWPKILDSLPDCSLKNECIRSMVRYCEEKSLDLPEGLTERLTEDVTEDVAEDPSIVLVNSVLSNQKKIRTRIPPNFTLTTERIEIARKSGLNGSLQEVFDEFVSYWQGSGITRADWNSTWRNHCIKEAKKQRINPKSVKYVAPDDPEGRF